MRARADARPRPRVARARQPRPRVARARRTRSRVACRASAVADAPRERFRALLHDAVAHASARGVDALSRSSAAWVMDFVRAFGAVRCEGDDSEGAVVDALARGAIRAERAGRGRVAEATDARTGRDAVCWCAKFGRGDAIRMLARETSSAGASCSNSGESAVMAACVGASRALTPTQLSKSSGSSVSGATWVWADDADVVARTRERYCDALRAVLEVRSSEINRRAANGWTPLAFACRHSDVLGLDFIAALLAAPGVDVNLADAQGKTALMHAASADSAAACELLRNSGADASARDERGFTAAMHAAFRNPSNVALLAALAADDERVA